MLATAGRTERVGLADNRYRRDIDGVRALAVISVMLFHIGNPYTAGGFVGVDVFFVVSGYLITQILVREIDTHSFSLWAFFERRVRRILPALFVMLAASSAVGYLILFPREFAPFTKTAAAAALSVSNFVFAEQSGYFDLGSDLKPLLHTWSLGVEEQFYIVFPLFFFICRRYFHLPWVLVIAPAACGSVAVAILQTQFQPAIAFYWTISRAWEFLVGSALAAGLFPAAWRTRWLAELAATAGLCLILCAVVLFDRQTPFPGAAAIVPCLGTALLLHANSAHHTWIGRLLSLTVLRGIGIISFSLYLWHWPLLAFARILFGSELGPWVYAGLFAATFPIAWLSWRFIEQPVRSNKTLFSRRTLFVGAGLAATLFLVGGLAVSRVSGMPSRFSPQALAIANAESRDRTVCMKSTNEQIRRGEACRMGAPNAPPTFVVIGDSFAAALLPGFDSAGHITGKSGLLFSTGGCHPLLGAGDLKCREFLDAAFDYVASNAAIDTIILVSRWPTATEARRFGAVSIDRLYISDASSVSLSVTENRAVFARGLDRSIQAASGQRVVVVTGIPEQQVNIPLANAPRKHYDLQLIEGTPRGLVDQRYAYVRGLFDPENLPDNVSVVDLRNSLCDTQLCRGMDGDRPLYSDDNHLNEYGASLMGATLAAAL